MEYNNIKKGIFKSRPNRFIAICDVDEKEEVCHVKNTGRCRELLCENAVVYLEESGNPKRKTKYDLIAVEKGEKLFNIDSQAPNKVVFEWLDRGGLFDDVTLIKPECKYKNSRFDFYVEHGGKGAYIEVKGVTLEEDGVLLFPDAPTQRGTKHINELIKAIDDGFEAYVLFVVQTDEAKYFTPNKKTDSAFYCSLENAQKKGVKILCYSCKAQPDSLKIKDEVPVIMQGSDGREIYEKK